MGFKISDREKNELVSCQLAAASLPDGKKVKVLMETESEMYVRLGHVVVIEDGHLIVWKRPDVHLLSS